MKISQTIIKPLQVRSQRKATFNHNPDHPESFSPSKPPEFAVHAVRPTEEMTLPQLNTRLLEAKELKARTESNLKDYDSIDKKFDDFLTGKQNVLPLTYTRTLDELGSTAITMDLAKRSFERIIEKLDLVVAELNREIKKREKR